LTSVLLALLAGPGIVSVATMAPTWPPGQRADIRPALPLPAQSHNHIYEENQRSGTTRWQSAELGRQAERRRAQDPETAGPRSEPNPSLLPSTPQPVSLLPRGSWSTSPDAGGGLAQQTETWTDTDIRGYAGQASINQGEAIDLHVGTTRSSYTMEVYRMGWYGGTGARLIQTVGPLPGQNPPVPKPDANGMVALTWPTSYTLQTGADWVTGFYLVKLISSAGDVAYLDFVLRDDAGPGDLAYQVAFNTYQAYNNWGGKSLYDFNSSGIPAYKVSYDRPYTTWSGAGALFDGEYNMIRFLESQNYSLSYATSVDTHANASLLNTRKAFVSVWHDEYWSKPMRDNVTAARDQGIHLAFFDANDIY
jgi:hypothetical protein